MNLNSNEYNNKSNGRMSFKEVIESKKFAVTCEIGPPKGAEEEEIKEASE